MANKIVLFGDELGLLILKEALPDLEAAAVVYSWKRPAAQKAAGQWQQDKGSKILKQPSTKEPASIQAFLETLKEVAPDLGLCCSYDLIISPELMKLFRKGILNVHGSLLPRYRGANALNWVLINGEGKTGVTIHLMTQDVDQGPILAQKEISIADTDTAVTLREKIASGAVILLRENWGLINGEKMPLQPQDESQATSCRKRKPEDGLIDWHQPAREIYNLIRGLVTPWPGAFYYDQDKKKVIIDRFLALSEVKALQKEQVGQVIE